MVFGIDDAIMLGMGGAKLISSITGARKQAKIAAKSAAEQAQYNAQQIELARQEAKLARSGQIDQYGNSQVYDEATNTWKTNLSAQGQQMSDADRGEQLRQLQYDAPLARGELIQAAARRSREGSTADALGMQLNDQISGKTGTTGASIASSLRRSRTEAANAGMRQAAKSFNTNATRTGMSASAVSDALSSAGRNQADYLAQTMGNPELEGMNAAEELNTSKRGSLIDAYSAMASRATGSPGFQYTPSGMSGALSSSLANARNGGLQGTAQAGSMVGQTAASARAGFPLRSASVPNYDQAWGEAASLAGSFLPGGSMISSLMKKRGASGGGFKTDTNSYAGSFNA